MKNGVENEYGEIAQLARARGSYPRCRGFESPSRYFIWDLSSAGRASALQAEGHRFKSCRSHLFFVNIKYGGIAQLARARGSYPRCRWFKSSSRYYKKESLCGASFCVISILSFMKTLNIICHIPTFILKL